MGEPKALHPFSSHFRSQLSDVLSRPAMVSRIKQVPDEKFYLETEIDSYSGVEFDNGSITKRPPTPPKPVNRTFTFDKTNTSSNSSGEANTLSLPKYAEVNKPKNRPKVPPKPKILSKDATTNTLPHTQKLSDEQSKISKDDNFLRVNSLPNLTPKTNHNMSTRASGSFLLAESQNPSTPSRNGQLERIRQTDESSTSIYHMAHNDTDYCDVLSESPPCISDYTATSKHDNRYENVYEDVNTKTTASEGLKLQPSSKNPEDDDSDYTLMSSPVSEINFTFGRQSHYQNCVILNSTNSDVFNSNEYKNVDSPKFQLGDHNRVGLPEQVEQSQIPTLSKDHMSPTSSCDDHDSSVYSIQSSMASTTASSFQRLEVCFFPPSPPPDFYQVNGSLIERPGSVTSGSSTRSRSSRSRIPVPIKPKCQGSPKTSTTFEPDQKLPPTPTPSPVVDSKNHSKHAKQIELSPPSPPGDELTPTIGKGLGSSGKGARWYEKLGCIQTDTIQPSEPYGCPGERKRSKSLNKEHRKSQFFLPVEPNASNPPIAPHT